MQKKKKKFLRRDSNRFSKLGKKRKKLQKWRKAKGRDSKIRLKRFGYPKGVRIGYKSTKTESGKLKGLYPYWVYNTDDLDTVVKGSVVIIGKVGTKKKLEIIKKALEMKLKISNVKEELYHATK